MKNLNRLSMAVPVCVALLVGLLCMLRPCKAQAPNVPTPTLTLNYEDGATVHQSSFFVMVQANASDATGLQSLALAGGYTSGVGYPGGANACSATTYFFVGFFPVGDYVFDATATSVSGAASTRHITLHLVP